MRRGGRTAAQARIGDGDGLCGTVVAAGISGRRAHDAATTVFVIRLAVLFPHEERLDGGHIQHIGNRHQLISAGRDHQRAAIRGFYLGGISAGHFSAGGGDRRTGLTEVRAAFDAHDIQTAGLVQQIPVQLVCRLENANPRHAGQILNFARPGRGSCGP